MFPCDTFSPLNRENVTLRKYVISDTKGGFSPLKFFIQKLFLKMGKHQMKVGFSVKNFVFSEVPFFSMEKNILL